MTRLRIARADCLGVRAPAPAGSVQSPAPGQQKDVRVFVDQLLALASSERLASAKMFGLLRSSFQISFGAGTGRAS